MSNKKEGCELLYAKKSSVVRIWDTCRYAPKIKKVKETMATAILV